MSWLNCARFDYDLKQAKQNCRTLSLRAHAKSVNKPELISSGFVRLFVWFRFGHVRRFCDATFRVPCVCNADIRF